MSTPVPPASIKRMLPWLVAVAFFMESLDTTILNTAVPTIAEALKVTPLSLKSALTSYMLSLAVFIPISGWVADRYGTRRVFASAIGVFTLGSLLCGLAPNLPLLVSARIVQGVGGAMMMPVGRITMVRTFPKSELVRAMSFVAIPGLIGPLFGPLAGGLIVGYFHWRLIFFVNLPIGLLGLYLVYRHLPDYRAERSDPIDWNGFVLFGAGIGLLSYVLEVFGEHSLQPVVIAGLLLLSAAFLALYVTHALRKKHPLLQLALFRIRTFRSAVTGSFITRLGVGGMPFLLPLLYQVGLGYTPIQSGLLIMPQPLAAMSLKMLMPRILSRIGYRRVLLSNTAIIGMIIALFSLIHPGFPAWLIVLEAFAFGFFSSLQYTCMNSLVFADLSAAETSMGSSIASAMQQMSMSFGVAVSSLIAALFIGGRQAASPAQMTSALRHSFLVLGAMTVVSTLIFRQLRPNDGASISSHKEAEAEAAGEGAIAAPTGPHLPSIFAMMKMITAPPKPPPKSK
jgi:EmrB/QacA subfamily drug resistance transporter